MVLKRAALVAATFLFALPQTSFAQRIESIAPIIELPEGLAPNGIEVGKLTVYPSARAGVRYDDNIYASRDNTVDDFIYEFTPSVRTTLLSGGTALTLSGEMRIRRYNEHSSENATGATISFKADTETGKSSRLRSEFSWRRVVEDRGDPEARRAIRSTDPDETVPEGRGPRLIDLYYGEAAWAYGTRRWGFSLRGTASRIENLSSLDRDRDFDTFSGRAGLSYQMTAGLRGVIFGFATRRDFRLAQDFSGIDRDSSTYGARAGIQLADTGLFRGEASIGAFHFSPDDPALPSRTGISAEASLSYLPTRRIAFTLDAFQGDVATVRNGATARTDTTVRLGTQIEARSWLRLQGQVFYRRSAFLGSGNSETSVGAYGEIEYLLNPYLSVSVNASYVDRRSDVVIDRFERARIGVALTARY